MQRHKQRASIHWLTPQTGTGIRVGLGQESEGSFGSPMGLKGSKQEEQDGRGEEDGEEMTNQYKSAD